MRDNWVIIMIVLCLAIFCVGTYGYFFTDKDVYSNPTSTTYVPPYNKIGSPKIFPNGMSVNVEKCKFTDDYYCNDRIRSPPEGAKYLWAYISAKNVGDLPENIPSVGNIYLSYKGRKYRPLDRPWIVSRSYLNIEYYWTQDKDKKIKLYPIGMMVMDPDSELGLGGSVGEIGEIYPGIKKDGWIFFEIPQNFYPKDAILIIWAEKWRLS